MRYALRLRRDEREDRKLDAPTRPSAYAYDTYLRARRDIGSFVLGRWQRAEAELPHALAVVGDDALLYSGLSLANRQSINAGISGERVSPWSLRRSGSRAERRCVRQQGEDFEAAVESR